MRRMILAVLLLPPAIILLMITTVFAQDSTIYLPLVQSDMPGSKYAFEHCLTLPLYHELTTDDQTYIVDMLKQTLNL